ncbi:MAG: LptF/LptG family permease [Ekhidna sp.]|nr:LptF/LptG family permease [Ekhidna sp.]MBC6410994.1 LptF/LptG family permease [Ekhidna sp.]MBC6425822.1 LptF/LptG family permease [Ekhidna sp.]
MKKIDKYILKKLLVTFVFVVGMLVLIICVIDFAEKNDDFIKNEVSTKLIRDYYLSFIPYIASLMTPITVFITTVLVTAKMAAKTEIIAILAAGISFKRMMFPYLVAAIIIGASSFYLNSYVMPDANKFRIDFELNYLEDPFYNTDKHIHFKVGPQEYIYLYRYDSRRDIGTTTTLERIEGTKLTEKITARQLVWIDSTARWKLKRWQRRSILDNMETLDEGSEIDTLLNLRPADFGNKDRHWETMTMNELSDYIELQRSRGADDVPLYQIEQYIRFMQPFTVVILMAIGVIMSARKSRQGTGFQIALGFLIAFMFIIAFILAKSIAEAGSMNTILAIWIPNIIFSVVSLLLYKTVPQ